MKRVILKSLHMVNFKGEKDRTTLFDKPVTTIAGANGLGKSRHFDAFIWLLFGKDAQDRKDYEVKTRTADGEELHNVECSVTGVMQVDGEEIVLKRSLVEDWVKPKGQTELKFKGNKTECWWNGVPCNVKDYSSRVETTIVSADVFKMLTNPAYFAGMKWQLQREQLFQLANMATDEEIAAAHPEFAQLLEAISGKGLEDFKKEISARKKRLRSDLDQIQPRIDQTQKMMPEAQDFDKLEAELDATCKKLSELESQLIDQSKAVQAAMTQEADKQKRIGELKLKQQTVVQKATEQASEEVFKQNAAHRDAENRLRQCEQSLKAAKDSKMALQVNLAKNHQQASELKARQDAVREQWQQEAAKKYNGETVCSHCGQQLPAEMIAKAEQLFNDCKRQNLEAITTSGKQLGVQIAELTKRAAQIEEDIKQADEEIAAHSNEEQRLQAELRQTKHVELQQIEPSGLPEWNDLQKSIEELEALPKVEATEGTATERMQAEKAEVTQQKETIMAKLSAREQIAKAEKEISRLKEEGRELAQQIADCEKEEYTIQQFTATKIDECEKRINGKFKLVKFRLFDYTIDGNPVETCIPTINGVPYGSANTASQINAGIDIINALSEFYKLEAPIFLDNAESVNEVCLTNSQMVWLKVTNDDKLTII